MITKRGHFSVTSFFLPTPPHPSPRGQVRDWICARLNTDLGPGTKTTQKTGHKPPPPLRTTTTPLTQRSSVRLCAGTPLVIY